MLRPILTIWFEGTSPNHHTHYTASSISRAVSRLTLWKSLTSAVGMVSLTGRWIWDSPKLPTPGISQSPGLFGKARKCILRSPKSSEWTSQHISQTTEISWIQFWGFSIEIWSANFSSCKINQGGIFHKCISVSLVVWRLWYPQWSLAKAISTYRRVSSATSLFRQQPRYRYLYHHTTTVRDTQNLCCRVLKGLYMGICSQVAMRIWMFKDLPVVCSESAPSKFTSGIQSTKKIIQKYWLTSIWNPV